MFKIINRQILASDVKRLDILALSIAREVQPGQFVIVTTTPNGDKISLPVIEVDAHRGSIALIFKETSAATKYLGALPINGMVHSVFGPIGRPARIEKVGVAACVADGLGIAAILPITRALKQSGNKVLGIISATTRKDLILQPQMRLACHKIVMTTQDGSYERRGNAFAALRECVDKEKIDLVYLAGSVATLESIAQFTKEKNIKTLVQLHPPMFDGTGVCGTCRVTVNNQMRLACVDGPEFDAHQVDFGDYRIRLNAFEELLWDNRQLSTSPKRNALITFAKFLSGILKK